MTMDVPTSLGLRFLHWEKEGDHGHPPGLPGMSVGSWTLERDSPGSAPCSAISWRCHWQGQARHLRVSMPVSAKGSSS